jgi:hypothetical protein
MADEGRVAGLDQHYLVPAVTAGWAAGLVDRVGLRRGERVLNVACGTELVARAAAEQVGRPGASLGSTSMPPCLVSPGRCRPAR